MIISVAPKAMIKNVCNATNKEMYVRWRFKGSVLKWFWLAKIISGRSQHVSTRSGVDRASVPIVGDKKYQVAT